MNGDPVTYFYSFGVKYFPKENHKQQKHNIK